MKGQMWKKYKLKGKFMKLYFTYMYVHKGINV